jgi:hypothetical protein
MLTFTRTTACVAGREGFSVINVNEIQAFRDMLPSFALILRPATRSWERF